MATTTFRSELVYRAPADTPPAVEVKSAGPSLAERVQKVWDLAMEYPGSKDNHEWFLVKWVEAKFFAGRGGTERR